MRIAVLIAGEFRTWSIAAKGLFDFIDIQNVEADYYFATWSTSKNRIIENSAGKLDIKQIIPTDITAPFVQYNKNLVSFNIFEQDFKTFPNFYYQSWLHKQTNIEKRVTEIKNNFVYDHVVTIRPDVYVLTGPKDKQTWPLLKNGEYVPGPHVFKEFSGMYDMPDLYSRTNSWTDDIIANRCCLRYSNRIKVLQKYTRFGKNSYLMPDSEQLLSDWVMQRKINTIVTNEFKHCGIVRENFPINYASLTVAELQVLQNEWASYTSNLITSNLI